MSHIFYWLALLFLGLEFASGEMSMSDYLIGTLFTIWLLVGAFLYKQKRVK